MMDDCSAKRVAHYLSSAQRDMLIEHVEGIKLIWLGVIRTERATTRSVLIALNLIRWNKSTPRPTHTRITDDGRCVLGFVLGAYVDALVAAGYGVSEPQGKTPWPQCFKTDQPDVA